MNKAATLTPRTLPTAIAKIFRKPKSLLILIFVLLALVAGLGNGLALVAPGLAAAMIAAAATDMLLIRYMDDGWCFPDGALLTGMIVGMILSPREPWHVAAVTSVVGIASKVVLRTHSANIFNPAALALVATFYIFSPGQNWWGAMPDMPPYALVVLIATGIFITDRVNKLPAVLAFLGAYFLLFTLTAFFSDPARVAEIYRTPDLQAVLFFGFFMVTDPPTSPPRARDQLVFGVITAVASYAVFELVGAAYFLLAGLLVANGWEAWRRVRAKTTRHLKARAGAYG
jgi:Na+-translocating ferredoxin:NAD+ oxidoreductase RnfD subunit